MKVGTDGVLLGALCPTPPTIDFTGTPCNVLDLGCGSGVVALMVAQRCPHTRILGLEIDPEAAAQAKENADNSPWGDRITILTGDARTFSLNQEVSPLNQEVSPLNREVSNSIQGFDLVVCNPPFYKNGQSSGTSQRDIARRADTLSFSDLITTAYRLLNAGGRLCVIIPYTEVEDFIYSAWLRNLQLDQQVSIRTKSTKPFRRAVLTFIKKGVAASSESNAIASKERELTLNKRELTLSKRELSLNKMELTLLDENSSPTDDYRQLVKDFYLWA